MIVCLCHPTSDRELDAIIDDGARTVEEVGRRCGAGTGCGACVGEIQERVQTRGAGDTSEAGGCNRDCSSSQLISTDMLAAARAR